MKKLRAHLVRLWNNFEKDGAYNSHQQWPKSKLELRSSYRLRVGCVEIVSRAPFETGDEINVLSTNSKPYASYQSAQLRKSARATRSNTKDARDKEGDVEG